MDLRQLRAFIAVAEEGHMTRAAERLGIQQPPLSRMIKGMEDQLEARLFRRKPRGVELTEAGRAFLAGARTTLADFDRTIDTTKMTARGERGRLAIGATATSTFNPLVARSIRAFRAAFPLVTVTLVEQQSSELIDQLRAGRIDGAFLWTPPTDGITVTEIQEDALVVAMPSDHPLAQGDPEVAIDIATLADETFVIYGRRDGFGLYAATILACHAAGFTPRFGQEAPRLGSALGLVAIGLGIFFVPTSIQRLQMNGVTFRPLTGANQPRSTLSLATRRGDPSPVVRSFLGLAQRLEPEAPTVAV